MANDGTRHLIVSRRCGETVVVELCCLSSMFSLWILGLVEFGFAELLELPTWMVALFWVCVGSKSPMRRLWSGFQTLSSYHLWYLFALLTG